MSLLLLLSGLGAPADLTLSADLGSLTATATVTFTPPRVRHDRVCVRRVGRAQPLHSWRKLTGYRVEIQGERPFYMAAIPITGATPPAAEMVWIEDLSGVVVGAIGNGGGLSGDILDMCHEERLGEYEALWLTVPADSAKADLLAVDVVLLWRDRRFRIAAREEHRDGVQATIELEAAALWLDLADRRLAGEDEMALSSVTPSVGLTQLLARTNWTVGMMPTDATTHTFSDLDASVLELIRSWAKVCGYEVDFDTKLQRVSFVTTVGEDRGIGFRYGHNLRTIERRIEPPKTTRIWPYGRDNIDITAVEPSGFPYVTDYSYYTDQGVDATTAESLYTRDEIWVDDSYVDDNDLYAAALVRLAIRAQPIISYTCKVIDLVRVGGPGYWTHSIGDTIGVRDSTFDIDVTTRVVRLKRYPLRPYDNEVELASLQPSTTESTQTRSFPGSSEWLLYRDRNDVEVVLSGTTEQEIAILPRFLFLDNRGEYLGDSKITATLSGSGTLRLRAVNIQQDPYEEIESGSFSFNSATFATWTYDLPFSAKGKSGRERLMFVGSITSGAGTATVAIDAGLVHVLVRGLLSGPVLPPENSETFSYTGAAQYWTVPDGVTQIWASVYGAQGGSSGGTGGLGGYIKVAMDTVPGEVLQVNVGGQGGSGGNGGSSGGGFNGGGGGGGGTAVNGKGGGGASDLRRNAYDLVDRIVTAGGGGGAASTATNGGAAGYPTGVIGAGGSPGGPGTQSAGGAGGNAPLFDGTAGASGQGGDAPGAGFGGGGGGGGGLYGGGGGGSGQVGEEGSGGGGSSGFDEAQGVELVEHTTGARSGNGEITIEW